MSVYVVGPFHLNPDRLTLTCHGKPIALGPKVVETLLAFVERPGEILAKSVLLDRVWPQGFVEEANVSQNIYVLRKTFRKYESADPIETVPGQGYRLTAPVRFAGAPPEPWQLVASLALRARDAAPLKSGRGRQAAAAIAGAAILVASLALVASYHFGHRVAASRALSENGARFYEVGRYYWNLRTRDGVQRSLSYFARVINSDPYDARGYAALADANITMGDYCYGTHQPAVYFARAREYAKRAIALDPESAEAHAALGFLALHRMNATVGMSELRRAIALDPSYGDAHEWYGIALLRGGKALEGLRQLKIAADLDPLAVATIAWLGAAAYQEGRFGDAIVYSRQALELAPNRTDALRTIGEVYEAQGRTDRAVDAFKRFGAVDPYNRPEAAALLSEAYALGHRMREARTQLAYARASANAVDRTDLLVAAAAVGDRRVALDMLRGINTHVTGTAIENAAHLSLQRDDAKLRKIQADTERPASSV